MSYETLTMHWLDWLVVVAFFVLVLGIGILSGKKVKNSSSLKISFKLLLEKLHTCQIPIARSYPESSVLFFSENFSEIFRKHEAFRIINQCILNKHLSICGISLCLTQDARKDTIIPNSGTV